jgi:hypothetical protein
MPKDICRAYPPVAYPLRLKLTAAYCTPRGERSPAQTAVLDAEIARTKMTRAKAERILRTWIARGFAPFSAMDIAELEVLGRAYGSLEAARQHVEGDL